MENTKLVQVIKTFTKSEFEEFGKFVSSPFFNSSAKILKLFRLLKETYPEFESDRISKENVFKEIYPGEEYKDKKVRDLLSRMLKLAEDFLGYTDISNHPLLLKRHAMLQLGYRNLTTHFDKKTKEVQTYLENQKIHNNDFLYHNYLLTKDIRNYYETKKSTGKRIEFFHDISKEINQFIDYFILKMLKYYTFLINHEKMLNFKFDADFLDEIIFYVKERIKDQVPVILVFYYIVLINKNLDDGDSFYKLKEVLSEHSEALDTEDQGLAYMSLYNFTKIKSIGKETHFRKENFEILKIIISRKIYPLEDNIYIGEHNYINFSALAITNGDFEWADNFIIEYKELLHPEKRENAYNFSRAYYNYKKGDLNKALEGLAKVTVDDFYIQLRVKNNTLKIYYELGELEKTIGMLDSFKHFLSASKYIPDFIMVRFVSYVKFMNRLINAQLNEDYENIIKIRNEIQNADQVENQSWMLERIKMLNL